MKILGLDLGERRVGVAVSDEIGMFAHPVTTLEVTGDRALIEQVRKLADEHAAERLVVGMPYNQDGTMGPRAQRVEALGNALAAATAKPVEWVDERFTSQEAQRALLMAPKKVRREKGNVDKLAAALILQSYLDTHRP